MYVTHVVNGRFLHCITAMLAVELRRLGLAVSGAKKDITNRLVQATKKVFKFFSFKSCAKIFLVPFIAAAKGTLS